MRLKFLIVLGRSRTLSEKFKKNLNTKKVYLKKHPILYYRCAIW